ncbi:MAG: tetratricopeptide repeat protein [Rhabdochlamydiaceae bacterium]|nr:tetratricopeptide repeat protein [Rhabdochlamydiaceae bacterium]
MAKIIPHSLLCSAVLLLAVMPGCQRVPDKIEPTIQYAVQDKYLQRLPSPFPPLSIAEQGEDWAKEYQIGMAFAHALDLYQAITAFKRAEILIPKEKAERSKEIQYEIFLCYYVGKKYADAIHAFEYSQLKYIDPSFPALHDMLLALYDSYLQEKNYEQAQRTLQFIEAYYPQEAEKLAVSTALVAGELPLIRYYGTELNNFSYLNDFVDSYERDKKSVGKAQFLNAVVPGAGYLYLGQPQSAFTAFLLNGLFIAAATGFFTHGNIAAGAIFTSFEAGWYFGGIYGAGLEAKYSNERLYEQRASPMMNQQGLFPVLMLNYAF